MTKSSKPRATRRVNKKVAAKTGGNGQTAAATPAEEGGVVPVGAQGQKRAQLVPVADMKPKELKKLREAEHALLKLLAEIGDLTIQIEQARQRQLTVSQEVARRRQDLVSLMKGTVISHGFDPDTDKFNLNPETGKIERIVQG